MELGMFFNVTSLTLEKFVEITRKIEGNRVGFFAVYQSSLNFSSSSRLLELKRYEKLHYY